MPEKLKPCPFCGGAAEVRYILGKQAVVCKDCNAYMMSDYTPIEMLVEMWNRRLTMTKCEICYHVDVCKNYLKELGYELGVDYRASRCPFYKDKSLIVELPCKVGDDLYWINNENKVECLKNEIIGVVVKNDGFEVLDTDGNIDKLGTRYTYLTRAEAEQALKERENNE